MTRFSDQVRVSLSDGTAGEPISGATVYVYEWDYPSSSTGALSALTDDDLTTALPNPLTTDEFGQYYFNSTDGLKLLELHYGGRLLYRQQVILTPTGFYPGNDAALRNDLLTTSGPSLIGFDPTVAYTAGTVGSKLAQTVCATDAPFNAKGDGSTEDTAAVQAAATYLGTLGGGELLLPGRHVLGSITLPDYVWLRGVHQMPDEKLPATADAYQSLASVILLKSGATITTGNSSGAHGLIVMRQGLTLPFADATAATAGVAAFAGTAFTVGGAGSYFSHLLILGFNQAIYSTGHERVRCEYVQMDCTNGIHIDACFDIPRLEKCHFWEFTTTHQAWTTDALLTRTGKAYWFSNVADWASASQCFSYGAAIGFLIDGCDHGTLNSCGADYPPLLSSTSVGAQVQGTSREWLLHDFKGAAQGTGVLVNTTGTPSAGTGAVVAITASNFWGCDTYSIRVQAGRAVVTGGTRISNAPVGVQIDSGSQGAMVIENVFDTVTTPVAGSGLGLELSILRPNMYINCVDTQGQRRLYDNQTTTNYESSYSTNTVGYTLHARQARGTAAAPTISQAADSPWRVFADVHDGTGFFPTAAIRMQADTAPAAGSVPGKIILSTTAPSGTSVTDRWVIDSTGALYPVVDLTYSLGASAQRLVAVYTQFVIQAPLTVATLPAAGVVGRRAFVTDATATTFGSIVAGGGSNKVPVYDDGAWRIG